MHYDVYLFDLDNTLMNTIPATMVSHNAIAKLMNFPPIAEADIRKHLHETWEIFINSLFPGINIDEFRKKFIKEGFHEVKIPQIDGALDLIESLRKMGRLTGLVSNRTKKILYSGIKQGGFTNAHFDFIQPFEDWAKPDPRIFNDIKIKLNGHKAIYIGDAIIDYQAANEAGLDFFAVLTGAATVEKFQEAGLNSERIFPSVKNILNLL